MARTIWTAMAIGVVATLAGTAEAKVAWLKKAQAEDPTIKSCLACHTSMKATATDPQLGPRGRFLLDKKKEQKAAEVDLKWLKDYKDSGEKK
jgi:hypothetical protein